jgi:hypothetical protein
MSGHDQNVQERGLEEKTAVGEPGIKSSLGPRSVGWVEDPRSKQGYAKRACVKECDRHKNVWTEKTRKAWRSSEDASGGSSGGRRE